MKTEHFLIPLEEVTELEIRILCDVFSQFHKVDIPEDFIEHTLTLAETVPNVHLEITHRPLSIGLTVPERNVQTISIGLCIEVYQMINDLSDSVFAPEPVTETKVIKEPDVVTVKEAALEYQELWRTFIAVADRLGIQPIAGGRVANIKNMLQIMEQNFKRPTIH